MEAFFGVEAETLAGAGTTGTTGPLSSRRAGYRTYQEGFHSYTGIVDFLLGEARVDDVDNTVNGEGGLGDIGADDAFASRWSTGDFGSGGG